MSSISVSSRDRNIDAPLGTSVKQLSEQTTRLIRDQFRLALTEMPEKAKHVGACAGLAAAGGVGAPLQRRLTDRQSYVLLAPGPPS